MPERPILILGGGINGAAVARELALNGASVVLVDSADLAYGATAYSSRLIHGGLRYLEYGEFGLVRESLAERERLLRLAPHLVHALRLFIPVSGTWGGLASAASKFLGVGGKSAASRGKYLIQSGLLLYDVFARDRTLPSRSSHRRGSKDVPTTTTAAGEWLCAYSDAQIDFPERLVIDLLSDARGLAQQYGERFDVLTYHRAKLEGDRVVIKPLAPSNGGEEIVLEPAAIINATGAWVDDTLARLPIESPRLMGGTKGSHLFTWQLDLRERLGGQAIYTEADDGRPVFILPFRDGTLIGTTDLPFQGDPATAVASDAEIDYLLAAVRRVVADVTLQRSDIAFRYSGVRPLPYADAKTPGAITRRHQLVWNDTSPVPLVSLVGGKLTTCRSLAEETAKAVLSRLGKPVDRTTRDRPIPGAAPPAPHNSDFAAAIDRSIDAEWATSLEDIVERRLMLLYDSSLSMPILSQIADQLVARGRIAANDRAAAVAQCVARLQQHFGRSLAAPTKTSL